jgi:hypothetical protein
MSEVVRNAREEFWRPPQSEALSPASLADTCHRCGTEFMVGAAFCHICGLNRHTQQTASSRNWTKYLGLFRALEFSRVKDWLGLPLPAFCAFLAGVAFMVAALAMGLVDVRDSTLDFEAVQLWRIEWLIAACAAFLAGVLLKNRKV